MWQVLCLTGRGFDTCWRPGNIATNQLWAVDLSSPDAAGPHSRIRYVTE